MNKLSPHQAYPTRGPSVLYEDKRFKVTLTDLRTPTIFYPIYETVGRVRRDILFAALAWSALILAALLIYFDLWQMHERFIMVCSIGLVLMAGTQISFLELNARGFPSRIFVARSRTVKAIFNAITDARAQSAHASGGFEPDDMQDDWE
jgi:hypothetical protein